MVEINSDHVIIDHTWLWRADHDKGGQVKNGRNFVENALVVNGEGVTVYGLFAEHTLGDLVQWNGDKGKTYFMQSEMPYDVTSDYNSKVGYRVNDSVTTHEAFGVGVYTYFRDHYVTPTSAISVPKKSGIKLTNSKGVFLNGQGGLVHLINNDGLGVSRDHKQVSQCTFGEEYSTISDASIFL
jgi:hypothetical protein